MGDDLKSAYELAMEKLRTKEGDEVFKLTDEQKAGIEEARNEARAKLAEREILYKSQIASILDPADLQEKERQYRIDRDRIDSDRDKKIEKIRAEG